MRPAAVFLAVALLAGAAAAYKDCEDDDIYGILGHCDDAVRVGAPAAAPSAGCCYFVEQRTSLACVCKNLVGRGVEDLISMRKLARAAALCGVPIKPGTQCGSYRVPKMV